LGEGIRLIWPQNEPWLKEVFSVIDHCCPWNSNKQNVCPVFSGGSRQTGSIFILLLTVIQVIISLLL